MKPDQSPAAGASTCDTPASACPDRPQIVEPLAAGGAAAEMPFERGRGRPVSSP